MIITGKRTRLKACRHGWMLYFTHDSYIGRSLDLYGEYSESEISIFREILSPGAIVIEAGANIGSHTVAIANLVSPSGAVYAFEPQRQVHQVLCANLALNEIENVKTFQAGLGLEKGSIEILVMDYANDNNIGGLPLGKQEGGEFYESVDVLTIDSLKLPQLDFIKADVEGMEKDVLLGAKETIERCRPILYIENDRGDKSEALIQTVFDLGYRAWWHLALFYNPNNAANNPEDVFPKRLISVNMLCLPKEMEFSVNNMQEILSADASWQGAPILGCY